ncbi:NTF2-related export protein 2-like [Glandiceps talaboti]
MAATDFKSKVDQACEAAEKFHKLYYETFDRRRSNLSKLYLDSASLVWNGNACNGSEEVAKFFEQLPTSSFKVDTLDCHPVLEEATGGRISILVTVNGTVKFDGSRVNGFNQNFVLTTQDSVWKIASDCLRFQE